ncbi:hypothetical protein [Mucilaginibacter sp. PAMB04168]|uniref:hypothetical protein n=1 Tax=Mucilaginibacter sp. PAMB04168 TaxID=3138567 RepID=UPI0031F69364
MAANNMLIEVSAYAGFAGALLTQIINATIIYFTDKRKYRTEVKNLYRDKKIDIGENFYYLSGESMTMLKKSITFWKNRSNAQSEMSLAFLNKERKKIEEQTLKLNSENWRYNLISLYFNVSLSFSDVQEYNAKAQSCFLKILDLADRLNKAGEEEKDLLCGVYAVHVFDLCSLYEDMYKRIEKDTNVVRDELREEFVALPKKKKLKPTIVSPQVLG